MFEGDIVWRLAMERDTARFICRQNIKQYRELLKAAKPGAERVQIEKLLAEEQQKQRDAGDPGEG
jgi:hypothetical protein